MLKGENMQCQSILPAEDNWWSTLWNTCLPMVSNEAQVDVARRSLVKSNHLAELKLDMLTACLLNTRLWLVRIRINVNSLRSWDHPAVGQRYSSKSSSGLGHSLLHAAPSSFWHTCHRDSSISSDKLHRIRDRCKLSQGKMSFIRSGTFGVIKNALRRTWKIDIFLLFTFSIYFELLGSRRYVPELPADESI